MSSPQARMNVYLRLPVDLFARLAGRVDRGDRNRYIVDALQERLDLDDSREEEAEREAEGRGDPQAAADWDQSIAYLRRVANMAHALHVDLDTIIANEGNTGNTGNRQE